MKLAYAQPAPRDWKISTVESVGSIQSAAGVAVPLTVNDVVDNLAALLAPIEVDPYGGLYRDDLTKIEINAWLQGKQESLRSRFFQAAALMVGAMLSFWPRARTAAEGFLFTMGNAYITDLLTLEFNNTNIALVGDATGLRGSSTAGSLYVALHTAQPSAASDQTSNEASFTSYVRVAVARSSGGWTISSQQVSNAAAITFAQNTGSDQTVTHFSVGVASSSTSKMLRYGPLVVSGATWLALTAKTDDTITVPGHSFSVDDRIVFQAAYDGSLPTGITAGTVYWVKTVSGNDITISTSQGGSALDITAVGTGVCIEAKPLTVRGGIDAVQFAIGTLVSKIG